MFDWHPNAVDLLSLEDDKASRSKADLVLHLMQCSECWWKASDVIGALDDRLREGGGGIRATPWARDPVIGCLLERYRLEQVALEVGLLSFASVADVRRLKRKARREVVVRDRRKHNLDFVKSLLAEARAVSAPIEGEEWAALALIASQQIPPSEVSEQQRADLLAECYAELAGARRRSARWIAARDALRLGGEHAEKGTGSGFVLGILAAMEGLVEGDCGGLERAELLLKRAAEYFASVGSMGFAAKAKIQIAYIYLDVAPAKSIHVLAEAELIIPSDDKRLQMFAESIRIDALITSGLVREAMLRFDALKHLYYQFGDPFVQLRRRFTAGRLLEALGRFTEADALFGEVIAADLEQRSNKSFFLDLIYMVGSYVRRNDKMGAVGICQQAIQALSVMELDEDSETQMRKLWSSLGAKLHKDEITATVITAARQYIKTQWRIVGGDALLIKEAAV